MTIHVGRVFLRHFKYAEIGDDERVHTAFRRLFQKIGHLRKVGVTRERIAGQIDPFVQLVRFLASCI